MAMLLALALLLLALAATSAAPSSSGGACQWSHDGNEWDLSMLIKSSGNYIAQDRLYKYYINPCSIVVDRADCTRAGNNICQYSQPDSFVASLGKFTNDSVKWSLLPDKPASAGLQYTMVNGDTCFIAGREQQRTVHVQFECNPNQDETFTVTENEGNCEFYVVMKTPLACPTGRDVTPCVWTEPHSGLRFDVRDLRSKTDMFSFLSPNNYTLNLCGPTMQTSGSCAGGQWAVCQYSYRGEFMAGLASFNRAEPGQWSLIAADPTMGASLTFKNGDSCWNAGVAVPRTTTIDFVCNPTGPRRFSVTADLLTCAYKLRMDVSEGCPYRS